jgi:hypothetical protein
MVTDYVIINVDGSLTLGEGFPREVGCHELHGRPLPPRRRDGLMWRLLRCQQSAAMPDEHPLNNVARLILIGLRRSIEPEEVRGAAALLLVGADNEQLPIPPRRVEHLQQLARVSNSLDVFGTPPPAERTPPPRDVLDAYLGFA